MNGTHRAKPLVFPRADDLSDICIRRLESVDYQSQQVREMLKSDSGMMSLICSQEFWSANCSRLVHPAPAASDLFQSTVEARRVCRHSDAYKLYKDAIVDYRSALVSKDNFIHWLAEIASQALGRRVHLRKFDVGVAADIQQKFVSFSDPGEIEDRLEQLRRCLFVERGGSIGGAIFAQAVLLNIHPFEDANGRVARALFNCHFNAAEEHGELFLPLSIISKMARGAYEIKVRDAEINGNWVSLIDYFSEVVGVISESSDRSVERDEGGGALVVATCGADDLHAADLLSRLCSSRELEFEGPMSHSLGHGLPLSMLCMSDDHIDSQSPQRFGAYYAYLDSTLTLLESRSLNSSLYKGVTGFALAAQLAPSGAVSAQADELLRDLDDILEEQYSLVRNPDVDLVNGLAGVLVYASCRSVYGRSVALKAALRSTVFETLSSWGDRSEVSPSKRALDLGVAHGVPGLLLVAVGAYGAELSQEERKIVQMAAERIWNHAIALSSSAVAFPSFMGGGQPSRLAWCYGGLGLGLLFERLCRLDDSWSQPAASVVNGIVLQFKSGDHGMKDASLCHGFAGAALVTHLLSRSPHFPVSTCRCLSDVSHDLHRKAMSLEMPGIAFLSDYNGISKIRRSLLEGAAGIALVDRAIRMRSGVRPWMAVLGVLG